MAKDLFFFKADRAPLCRGRRLWYDGAVFKAFDRYVLKEIASPFAVGLAVYTFTLLVNQILILSKTLISKGATLGTVLQILVYLLPNLLSFTIPMTTLMGVLAGLSRMSSDSEIVALRTMGVQNFRLLRPVIIFSLIAWLFSSWLTMYLAPEANYRVDRLITRVILSQTIANIKPGTFYKDLPFYVLYIEDIDARTNEWKSVILYSMKAPEEDTIFFAKRGRFIAQKSANDSYIVLYDGTVHTYKKKEPEKYSLTLFSRKVEKIPNFYSFKQTRRSSQLIFPQLVKKMRADPADISLASEFQKKFAFPFTCLGFGILGLALGVSTKKGGKTSGFIISLGIIFVFYVLITVCWNMILKQILSPFWGTWLPNFFLVAVATFLYRYSHREKEINWEKAIAFVTQLKKRGRSSLPKLRARRASGGSRAFPLKIVDRYIFKKQALVAGLIFFSLLFVFYIINIVELIDNIIENKLPFIYVLKYVYYNTPETVTLILPIVAMTSALITFSLMSKYNETTALQVSGISLYRLAVPALAAGALISLGIFLIQEKVLPRANEKASETLDIIHNRKPQKDVDYTRNWIMGEENRIYFYGHFDNRKRTFTNFNVITLERAGAMAQRLSAQTARWIDSTHVRLKDAFSRRYREGYPAELERFAGRTIVIPESRSYFSEQVKFSSEMNIGELRRYIRFLRENHSDSQRYEAQLYYKYAYPLSAFIMVLIAVPFSFMMGNRGTLFGIGIAIAISMIFWATMSIFSALGSTAVVSPFWSAFAPLFIFAAISFYLLLVLRT